MQELLIWQYIEVCVNEATIFITYFAKAGKFRMITGMAERN